MLGGGSTSSAVAGFRHRVTASELPMLLHNMHILEVFEMKQCQINGGIPVQMMATIGFNRYMLKKKIN